MFHKIFPCPCWGEGKKQVVPVCPQYVLGQTRKNCGPTCFFNNLFSLISRTKWRKFAFNGEIFTPIFRSKFFFANAFRGNFARYTIFFTSFLQFWPISFWKCIISSTPGKSGIIFALPFPIVHTFSSFSRPGMIFLKQKSLAHFWCVFFLFGTKKWIVMLVCAQEVISPLALYFKRVPTIFFLRKTQNVLCKSSNKFKNSWKNSQFYLGRL